MTPTEDWKEQTPVRREPSFAKKVAWAGLTVLLAGALGALGVELGFFGSRADDDDDRPPIIVRNGSVHLESTVSGGDGMKGQLEKGNGNLWHHIHGGKKPKNLSVVVADLYPRAGTCSESPFFFAQKVKTVTVTYTNASGEEPLVRTIVFDVGPDKDGDDALQIKAHDKAKYSATGDYALNIDAEYGAKLTSVTIYHKNQGNNDVTSTCEFRDDKGTIAILQRK